MIQSHGNTFADRVVPTDRSEALREVFEDQVSIELDRNLLFDFSNLATGVYGSLGGFLSRIDFRKVAHDMTLESVVAQPLPDILDVDADIADELGQDNRIGICSPEGDAVGVMDVEDIYRQNGSKVCEQLFGTTDGGNPGVRLVRSKELFLFGGPIKTLEDALPRNGRNDLSAKKSRVPFERRSWESVVGLQARNVPHRGHEYLQKSAIEHVDGLLVYQKIGEKKPGDYTNDAIFESYGL